MLQFILGKSGTGKTAYIYEQIKELTQSGDMNIIFIVPDQSSFETEKRLLELLGAKRSRKVNIFGFTRLCRHAFEQAAILSENVIDNATSAVIMNVVLEQLSEKLTLLKSKNVKNTAVIMLSTITECKRNGVTADMLYSASEKISDSTLKTKLYETALIYDTFDAVVAQSYINPLDDLDRLYNVLLEKKELYKDYTVFIDSFSGFTTPQLKVIRLLIERSKNSYISLTLDPLTDGKEDVFSVSHQTYKLMKNMAKADYIDIKPPVKLIEPKRFSSKELSLLESAIYRRNPEHSDEEPRNITLYSATDQYNECEFIAREIKKLIMKHGYLYSDITIICHNAGDYNGILNVTLEKYGIPYFMDTRKEISVKPVIRLVDSIFRMINENLEREDVISAVKSGLTPFSPEEIAEFENYVYVWNVSGKAFRSEFTNNPQGFSDNFTEENRKSLKDAEAVRAYIINPVLEFKENAKDKNGREISTLLYELLIKLGVPNALSSMYDAFEKNGSRELGAEQIKIWSLLMNALDKTVAVIGDMKLSIKRYYELLSVQISNIDFAKIPQTLDSVTVTTAQRVRLSNSKAAFLIGCIDGVFPEVPKATGLFSAFELKVLLLNEIKISEDFSYRADLETFMAYCCMTSASDRIFASYPQMDLQGNSYTPSSIITEIRAVFPKIFTLDPLEIDSREDSMLAEQPAFEEYARSLSPDTAELKGLYEYFSHNSDYSSKLSALQRSIDTSPFAIENPQNSEKLFGDNLTVSASQIEKFSLCHFAYFCTYGLRIRDRLMAEINPMEYGTLVHYVLNNFFSHYSKSEYSVMSDDLLTEYIHTVLSNYLESYFGGSDEKTGSFLYRLNVLEQNLFILVKHIITELAQSEFEVADCELNIGKDIPSYTLRLPTGQNIAICGSVDRVDIMKIGEETYLRVIDYKTGTKKFKLSDILYGLNLQMLLYLYAIGQKGGNKYGDITPAGILYMPATAPVIPADSLSEYEINTELDKKLKMNGLLLDNTVLISGMEKGANGKYIPAKIKADGGAASGSLATLEEFGKIFKKLDLTIMEMGKQLYQGNIEASPVKGAHDACEYCPYDSVCTYRRSKPKNTFDVSKEDVYNIIEQETEGKD